MIHVDDLQVSKSGAVICRVPRLDVSASETVAVLGGNGCGKTTLLRVLGGVETEYSGQCEIASAIDKRCYVHQRPYLFRGNAQTNVCYGLRLRGAAVADCSSMADEALDGMGLYDKRHVDVKHLSGGERRRVALARAFVLKPALLLLDEPFAELDSAGMHAVCRAIEQMSCTTVISSPREPDDKINARRVRPFDLVEAR